ncbi:MAG: protein kinase [Polyangiaceae bacterium]|nr:protein kinase [Polyangiaceae bacterium]
MYLARLADNPEQLVALKVVHEHLADEKEFIHQFLDEANLLLRLNHPNIVSVHELGREEQTLFLAIEYLDGEPLSRLYSALRRRNQRLEPDLIAWIGARVAEGLDYAHRLTDEQGQPMDLVHRDISPQNVFLTMDGRVKLIDFGIARAAGRIAQTTIGKIKGKFSYMAPEQVLSSEFDHRVDLFALGATLYEGAVGSRLFAGSDETDTLHKLLFEEVPDPRTQVPDFPDELARILGRALESKPEERYATGHEMARDLEAFLATRSVTDAPARLSQLLVSLFAEDRQRRTESIRVLKEATVERNSGVTLAPPAPRRWPWLVAAAAVVLVGAGIALSTRSTPKLTTPSASAAPVATTVTFEVTLDPPVEARIVVAGKPVTGTPARATLPKSDAPVTVSVNAEGYRPAKLSLPADRDRALMVPLAKVAPPPSAAPTTSERPKHGGPKPKSSDSLVTDYPF